MPIPGKETHIHVNVLFDISKHFDCTNDSGRSLEEGDEQLDQTNSQICMEC